MGSGVENIERATPDVAGQDVTHRFTDGAAHVSTYGLPGFLETKEFLLLAADTNEIAAGGTIVIPPTKLFTGSGFTTGLQRARLSIQINGAAADDFWGVRATLNALDNANACDRLSVDASLVAVNNVTTKAARMISPLNPVIEWILNDPLQVDRIDLALVDYGTTPPTAVLVLLELW